MVDGSDLFLAYTKEYPYSPHTPYFHQRAIEVFQQAGYADLVLQEKIAFVERYDVNGEYWNAAGRADPATADRDPGGAHDRAGQSFPRARAATKNRPTTRLPRAGIALSSILSRGQNAPRMNFLLAESLYDAKQYPQAIDEYEKNRLRLRTHKDSAEAGYAALVAFDALFKTTNASDVPALRRKRIKSAVRFTTTTRTIRGCRWSNYKPRSNSRVEGLPRCDGLGRAPDRQQERRRGDQENRLDDSVRRAVFDRDYAAAEKSYLTLLGFMPPATSSTSRCANRSPPAFTSRAKSRATPRSPARGIALSPASAR